MKKRVMLLLLALSAIGIGAGQAAAATFTVTNDTDNSGTACAGSCSLRQAITAANLTAGTDTINFDVNGGGMQTISPGGPLPDIQQKVVIDGTTQPGFTGDPLVFIEGPGFAQGLVIKKTGSTVRGLALGDWDSAIVLAGGGQNTIAGNWIGFFNGNLESNVVGIDVGLSSLGSKSNTIGGKDLASRNVISGNTVGIGIAGSSTNNTISGNFIGANPLGNDIVDQISPGVPVDNAVGVLVVGSGKNTIGGTAPGTGNLISGNLVGIFAVASNTMRADGNLIRGNLIGTESSGTGIIGNLFGVIVGPGAHNTQIGGPAGAQNTISGNVFAVSLARDLSLLPSPTKFTVGTKDFSGAWPTARAQIVGAATKVDAGTLTSESPGVPNLSLVQGNIMGLSADGNDLLFNVQALTLVGTNNNTISNNTIVGALTGAWQLGGKSNVYTGNEIALTTTGLLLQNDATANAVQQNTIFDSLAGVVFTGPAVQSNMVTRNSIYGTASLDSLILDSGANVGPPQPSVNFVGFNPSNNTDTFLVTLAGAPAGSKLTVEFFGGADCAMMQDFLVSKAVKIDKFGNGQVSVTVPSGYAGYTATATMTHTTSAPGTIC